MQRYSRLHDDPGIATLASGAIGTLLTGANAKVVVRSNMAPDITINLANIMNPSEAAPPISSENQSTLQWIKPEIELRSLGNTSYQYAPYGSPSQMAFIYFSIALVIASLLGARIAWELCRSFGKR